MPSLPQLIPDAATLLALAPEELAFYVLQAAVQATQNNMTSLDNVIAPLHQRGRLGQVEYVYGERFADVEIAVAEAWMWLEYQLFLVPADRTNARNGFRVLGRRAGEIRTEQQFRAFRKAAAFPKELLHPRIAERAWISLMRNEFDAAVIFSYRAIEEAVREACGYDNGRLGVQMMRDAFHPQNGPLTDQRQLVAEREALQALFAGAIGSYKNPHSHRTVQIADAAEAQEIVMLASHLLRIVDTRRQHRAGGPPRPG